jgi:hypothetical protein
MPAVNRWRTRPKAAWRLEQIKFTPEQDGGFARLMQIIDFGGTPTAFFALYNIGDGAAYDVEVKGAGCQAKLFNPDAREVSGLRLMAIDKLVIPNAYLLAAVLESRGSDNQRALDIEWTLAPVRFSRRYRRTMYLAPDRLNEETPVQRLPKRRR